MFFFDNTKEVEVTIRSEWGELETLRFRLVPYLTDQELAEALGTSIATVITHRRY